VGLLLRSPHTFSRRHSQKIASAAHLPSQVKSRQHPGEMHTEEGDDLPAADSSTLDYNYDYASELRRMATSGQLFDASSTSSFLFVSCKQA
jgi:hypothetical protein